MRPFPHTFRGLAAPASNSLADFRALPHLNDLPPCADDAPGRTVRLLDDALNLPDGTYMTMAMVHPRLGRPPLLLVNLLDRAGRHRPLDGMRMEPGHVEAFGQALQRFEQAAKPATACARGAASC
jgi:hypothetical protein